MNISKPIALTLPLLLCLSLANATVGDAVKFHAKRAKFLLTFTNEVTPYEELAVFVLPAETLILETQLDSAQDLYEVKASAGHLIPTGRHQWRWQAPRDKGVYRIKIKNTIVDDSITLHVFVMVPFSQIQGEELNGYRIGRYPSHPLKDNPAYTRPRGFIEVTRENEDTHVSPHFKLKQFLCKQPGGYPKYLVLRERLLLKLEAILEKVNESGYRCETFNVMSGYRTPYYNRAIGNTTTYSRHNWGDAADIFIDNDRDGVMDDLNHDDRIDKRDAAVLYNLIEKMQQSPGFKIFDGGLGMYDGTSAHGPFVHVDVRGFSARW